MSVKKRLDKINPPYIVEVMYDVEDNIPAWIGTCDKLHLVTEGRTYEELQQRVWEIAPECMSYKVMAVKAIISALPLSKLKATQISNAWRCNDGQWVLRSTYKNTQAIWLHILTSGKG